LTGFNSKEKSLTAKGYYNKGVVWTKENNASTLFHEFIHHFFRSIGNHCGSTRLFFDFLNQIYESIWCMIKYPDWRCNSHLVFESIKDSWNDWLDWMLCRDVGV